MFFLFYEFYHKCGILSILVRTIFSHFLYVFHYKLYIANAYHNLLYILKKAVCNTYRFLNNYRLISVSQTPSTKELKIPS